ncbi:hypothetical protein [Actinoplanes sp. NPDC089786]
MNAVSTTPDAIRDMFKQYAGLGVDEIILSTGTDDMDDITRLAKIVL